MNPFISGNAVTLSDSDNGIEGVIVAVTAVFLTGAGAIVDLIDFVRSLPFIFDDAIGDTADGDATVNDKVSGCIYAAGLIRKEVVVRTNWIKVMIVCVTRARDSLVGSSKSSGQNKSWLCSHCQVHAARKRVTFLLSCSRGSGRMAFGRSLLISLW